VQCSAVQQRALARQSNRLVAAAIGFRREGAAAAQTQPRPFADAAAAAEGEAAHRSQNSTQGHRPASQRVREGEKTNRKKKNKQKNRDSSTPVFRPGKAENAAYRSNKIATAHNCQHSI